MAYGTTDAELVRAYRAGDADAFDGLVRRHIRSLYGFVYRMVGNDRATAEDIVQETFMRAWKHLDRFDPERSFRAWLFSIGRNAALDRLRRRRDIPFALFRDDQGGNVLEETSGDDARSVDELLARADADRTMRRALDRLSPDQRTLLDLRYRDDLSLAEIAQVFGIPYNTVKNRHTRAIRSLKQAFLDEDASEMGVGT